MNPIYLDYAATTPLDPRVFEKMAACFMQEGLFGNPASLHFYGRAAKEAIELARGEIASLIHAEPSEIIFTSGATESNNLAIKGAARLYQRKGKHLITLKTEHKAVLDTFMHLEKEGHQVTYLSPLSNGLIDLAAFEKALAPETCLVSIMHVNNETGVVQNLDEIAAVLAGRQILFHVDAAQSIGKVKLNLQKTPIDLLSLSAHKAYGPKGIGALYLRKKPRVRVEPLLHGGGHEQGMRSGTLATHQIVGMGEAFRLVSDSYETEIARITSLRNRLWEGLSHLSQVRLNTHPALSVPHILNLRFEGMMAEAILNQLPHIATSTASACQGKGTEGSYVLRAMGITDAEAKSSVRFSLGRMTTPEQIDAVIEMITALMQAPSL